MKVPSQITAVGLVFLAACSSSIGQSGGQPSARDSEPRVVVVPPDELSRTPSVAPSVARPAAQTPSEPAPARAGSEPSAEVASARPAPGLPAKHAYNSCAVPGRQIAITFDDGPHPELTPKLLDLLKERGIKATFYVIGKNAAAHPEIVRRMVEEGHEVGNHSYNHPALNKLSAARVKSEMDDTTAAIIAAAGVRPKTMRPPYGATNAALNRRLDEDFGMKVIMWDVDPLDWKYRSAPRVTSQILENTKAGSIVLAHDIHASTVAAMPATLDGLKSKGFEFVTVSELIALDRPVQVASATPAVTE